MSYVLRVLLFPVSASWAAMSYPEIRSLVLDASFDDLLPLALKVMPDSWSESRGAAVGELLAFLLSSEMHNLLTVVCFPSGPLVQHTVRQYMNLNNAEQLCK